MNPARTKVPAVVEKGLIMKERMLLGLVLALFAGWDLLGFARPVDDPKLDPVWRICARYNKPVVIHVADPAAFFTPPDRFNEHWHELGEHPNWLFYGEKFGNLIFE